MKMAKNKTKKSAWFVTNCHALDRIHLVEQFMNISEVDIYGGCFELKCPKFPLPCADLNSTYRFYLAFENSHCVDYISEKIFKVMNDIVIPVVFNGAEMNRFLPPKSYIDADDFTTPEDLGNFLNFLADNPDEYVKYFWWKKHYKVGLCSFNPCDICKKINEPELLSAGQTYHNIDRYFFTNQCPEPDIKIAAESFNLTTESYNLTTESYNLTTEN
jgi:alpha-1,3-fucosyltransferase